MAYQDTNPGPMASNISTKIRANSRSPRATSFKTMSLPWNFARRLQLKWSQVPSQTFGNTHSKMPHLTTIELVFTSIYIELPKPA